MTDYPASAALSRARRKAIKEALATLDGSMTGRMVLQLSANWAVLADNQQWMLCKRRTKAHSGWKPLSYVASTKAVLLRCLREKGAIVDAQGQAALDALPESFRAWQRQMSKPASEAPVPEPATAGHARNSGLSGARRHAAHPTSRCIPQIPPLMASADTMDGGAR